MDCIIFTYLFGINVFTFWLYAMDKRYAYYNFWRIPEIILIILAALGGAYGALSAMLLFRHKTRHRLFTIGVPLCLVLWIFVFLIYLYF